MVCAKKTDKFRRRYGFDNGNNDMSERKATETENYKFYKWISGNIEQKPAVQKYLY